MVRVVAVLACMKPAKVLMMPVVMVFILVCVGHMLASLDSVDVLSCLFAPAAV